MLSTGLVSVTFRQLSPLEIVNLVKQAGLDAIEWGGDIHIPHGDIAKAREVAKMTVDGGLEVACYGSYYRLGRDENPSFDKVLETAIACGAPLIRVWAGNKKSVNADNYYREFIAADARRVCDAAQSAGILITVEHHCDTLADTAASAVQLMKEVDHPAFRTHWQPQVGISTDDSISHLENMIPWLSNVHVFQWIKSYSDRYPLADGEEAWKRYITTTASSGRDHYLLMEFVIGDDPEAFLRDAADLRRWVEPYGKIKD